MARSRAASAPRRRATITIALALTIALMVGFAAPGHAALRLDRRATPCGSVTVGTRTVAVRIRGTRACASARRVVRRFLAKKGLARRWSCARTRHPKPHGVYLRCHRGRLAVLGYLRRARPRRSPTSTGGDGQPGGGAAPGATNGAPTAALGRVVTDPTVVGVPAFGNTLECTQATFDPPPAKAITYSWWWHDSDRPDGFQNHHASDGTTRTITAGDIGPYRTLACVASAVYHDHDGAPWISVSGRSDPVSPDYAPVLTSASMTGLPIAGLTMGCKFGGTAGAHIGTSRTELLLDGVPARPLPTRPYLFSQVLEDATEFVVQDSDVGHSLACRYDYTNVAGSAEATTTPPSAPALAPPDAAPAPCDPCTPGEPAAQAAWLGVGGGSSLYAAASSDPSWDYARSWWVSTAEVFVRVTLHINAARAGKLYLGVGGCYVVPGQLGCTEAPKITRKISVVAGDQTVTETFDIVGQGAQVPLRWAKVDVQPDDGTLTGQMAFTMPAALG